LRNKEERKKKAGRIKGKKNLITIRQTSPLEEKKAKRITPYNKIWRSSKQGGGEIIPITDNGE
jgi:hypothetical protein